jgi:hypothetical protein
MLGFEHGRLLQLFVFEPARFSASRVVLGALAHPLFKGISGTGNCDLL